MKFLSTLFFLLVASSTLSLADVIRTGSMQASSDGVNVTLHWITDDEAGVAKFEIERRSGTDGAFVSIGTIDPKGASSYEYIDNSAFLKTSTVYQYRVKITFANGTGTGYSPVVTVTHTVSGVRRTWGSIKSMFR